MPLVGGLVGEKEAEPGEASQRDARFPWSIQKSESNQEWSQSVQYKTIPSYKTKKSVLVELTFPGCLRRLLEKGANLTSTLSSALPLYCLPLTCLGPKTEQASFKSPISTYELPEAEGTKLVCRKMGLSSW